MSRQGDGHRRPWGTGLALCKGRRPRRDEKGLTSVAADEVQVTGGQKGDPGQVEPCLALDYAKRRSSLVQLLNSCPRPPSALDCPFPPCAIASSVLTD
jgi:hypothetical protein